MNSWLENIFLISSALGFLLSLALMTHIFRPNKANFFLGLILLLLSFELLFSWGSESGYNNSPDAIHFWVVLSYHIIPPSIWLYVRSNLDSSFKLKHWHGLLFIPVVAEIAIHILGKLGVIP